MKFLAAILIIAGFLCFFAVYNSVESAEDIPISVTITVPSRSPSPSPTPPPGGGGGGGGGGETTVILRGRAYPDAFLTVLKNDKVTATFNAADTGLFEKTLTGLSGGVYSFGIFAEDTEKRRSVTLGFSVGVLEGMTTTISGIFISPTISLTPTQVEKGKEISIYGQAFPKSQVNIFIASNEIIKEAPATTKGKWSYKFNTNVIEEGEHAAKAKALFGQGEQSPFSQTLAFLVVAPGALVCKGADFNFDGKVNLVDFSIMMYWWKSRNPGNPCVDLNRDGIVDIVDFSILMYYWTG